MTFNVPMHEMPFARALLKLAELPEPPPDSGEVPQQDLGSLHAKPEIKRPLLHALGAAGGGALAFGAGIGAGHLGQMGVEKLMGKSLTPAKLHMAAPILGGAAALAYHTYKAKEQEQLRRALEAYKSKSPGTVPSE